MDLSMSTFLIVCCYVDMSPAALEGFGTKTELLLQYCLKPVQNTIIDQKRS